MVKRWGIWLAAFTSLVGLWGCRCSDDEKAGSGSMPNVITVLRVESVSPEKPGAEHCSDQGKGCSPLAPQQKLEPRGIVRTFAGGKVSLDFGAGRRVDLDALSETKLGPDLVKLEKGVFSLESTPLVEKESFLPLTFQAGGKEISSPRDVATTTSVSIQGDDTLLTVRKGVVTGFDFPGLGASSPQAGQTLRLTSAQVYRTGHGGQELPAVPWVVPRIDEFAGLLNEQRSSESRGLGTMTARLPNTDQVRSGVVLKRHHVSVVIRDGFARTEVEEEFENQTPHVLEGRYRFPIPGDASLSRLALWVGNKLMEGEVLEKKRAADIYARIVDRPVPRDPALLEWVTGGEMSLKVFPIEPKKTRRVILAYNQALSTENGLLRYVYPLCLGEGRENQIEDLSITVHLSDSKATLRNLRTPHHDARLGNEGTWKTIRVEMKDSVPTRDFILLADRDADRSAQLSAFVPSWGAVSEKPLQAVDVKATEGVQGHFALRISADLPEGTKRPNPLPIDRALVLDVSQSQSKETLAAQGALAYGILREMGPSERFVLLACDSACQAFPASGPTVASRDQLEKARGFLLEQRPGGSSDLAGGLVAAAAQLRTGPREGRSRQVVLINDGQASSGDLSAEKIAQRSHGALAEIGADVRLIGSGRTVDEDLLRSLAGELGATFDLLRSGTSLVERIGELSISLRRPVIRAPRIALPSSLRSDEATSLPALRLGEEIILTGEILDLTDGAVTLSGNLAGAPYELSRSITWEKSSHAQNPLVPRLFARAKIQHLQGKEETPEIKAEIIRLSQAHRTMSRHTSFLVLESERMYEDFGVKRTTKAEIDQPESLFSELEHAPAPPLFDAKDAETLTSFEQLERRESKTDAEEAQPSAASGRARPAPMPAPAPKPASAPKPKKSSGGMGELSLDAESGFSDFASGAGPRPGEGSGSLGSASQGAPTPTVDDEMLQPPRELVFPTRPRSIHRPQPRRAHLAFFQANDEWRKWGEKNIAELVEKLSEDRESRARHEAYVRGHLQHGRFGEARRDAEAFVKMDPDYAPARELLAYAAVVDGDHEMARKMLDVQTEAAPRDAYAHTQSARAFEAVGDLVRACAHYRALAELAPNLDQAQERATGCWEEVLGSRGATSREKDEGEPGQLQVDVKCDDGVRPQDCPSPVVVAPDGTVLSPWTPGVGRSNRSRITFVKLRSGDYYVMVLGGAPRATGKVVLTGRHENTAFKFEGGAMHTVAKVQVRFW